MNLVELTEEFRDVILTFIFETGHKTSVWVGTGRGFEPTEAEFYMIVHGKFGIERFALKPKLRKDKIVFPNREESYRDIRLKTPLEEVTGMSIEVHSSTPINFDVCSLADAKDLNNDRYFCPKGTDGKNTVFEECFFN